MVCTISAYSAGLYAAVRFYALDFIIEFMDAEENKVINIKSEMLFRSAEDDLFYLNKINSAYKKLKEAVLLTPNRIKILKLLADAAFIKGYTKKALEFYLKADKLNGSGFAAAGAADRKSVV